MIKNEVNPRYSHKACDEICLKAHQGYHLVTQRKGVPMIKIFLFLFLSSTQLFAEELKKDKDEDVYANKGNIDVGVSKSSPINRKDKKVSINVGAGYETVTAVFSFSLGYFVDKDLIIEARGAYGEDESEIGASTAVKRSSTASLGLKFFTNESFYIKPAFEYISVIDDDKNLVPAANAREELKGMGFSFVVGNQWQYKNFTIGVDWVGVKRVVNASTAKNDPNRNYFSLLGFYVGTTF